MKQLYFDMQTYSSPEEFHEDLAKKMEFPEYYGKNLDALYEVLSEIQEETEVTLGNIGEEPPQGVKIFLRVFEDAKNENEKLKVIVE